MTHLKSKWSGWPDNANISTTTPTSESAASSMPPQVSSDHFASENTTRHAVGHDLAVAAPAFRNSSLVAAMGQSYSKPSTSHKALSISNAAVNTGVKLKRAFAARRKKSEDSTKLFAQGTDSPVSGSQVIGGGRKASYSPVPPTPPPKPARQSPPPPPPPLPTKSLANNRGSIIPVSPGISSAVNFMRLDEDQQAAALAKDDEQKDVWRKSDSTMSHHTIRPGAGAGSRPSRPVSMAESLQSNHTVVPVNKRLSALITDAEFGPPEEESDSSFISASEEVPQPTSSSLSKVKNRRSMSLNLGSKSTKVSVTSSPLTSADEQITTSKSYPETQRRMSPSSVNETPTLTRAAANGIIAPSSAGVQSTGNNIRGRLAAWTAVNNPSSQNHHHTSRPVPPSAYHRNTPSPSPQPHHQRTATISITGSLAPAANLARRAAEKLGRWGFSTSSGGSGYSSSSSSTGYSSDHGTASRASSSQVSSSKGKQRRTPEAPSGAWSINSSAGGSLSDSDAFLTPAGPLLGTRIRGPLRINPGGAAVAGGIVFGRNLAIVVKETAVGVGLPSFLRDSSGPKMPTPGTLTKEESRALENRRLPAIVVRCAQHLLLWGVGEEGLFRVSGRPSHVAKLRHEFDTGADFNLQECSPGELDPHAVASIFKAFLRELPEPILTHSLLPYFEAALTHENATNDQQQQTSERLMTGQRGPPLPSGPKTGLQNLRKPPSLSTLAMPNFTGMRPPSRSFINALKSLVGQLPPENKDLVRTVSELIKATAKESGQTKMPLSNLLLVFCPSLNMNPPLLRVLCEADEIWEADDVSSVLDIKREDAILDISTSPDATDTGAEDDGDENDAQGKELEGPVSSATTSSSPASGRSSLERRRTSEERTRAKKPQGPRRVAHAPVLHPGSHHTLTVVDNDSAHLRTGSPDVSSESTSLHDDGSSYISTSDTRSESVASPFERGVSSPPPSSSAESLTTPSSSSAEPSLTHLPIEKVSLDEPELSKTVQIAGDDELTPKRYPDSRRGGAIHFPSVSDHSPVSPVSPRMSAPSLLLSSPVDQWTSTVPASPRIRRLKKPSLQLLFSKRSASSLSSPTASEGRPFISSPMISSPYMQARSTSSGSSSISTPVSAVTAPQTSTFALPVLDTPIESSPFRFGLGFDSQSSPESQTSPSESRPSEELQIQVEEPLTAPPIGETPIANRYCTPSSSTLSLLLSNSESDNLRPSHLRRYPTSRTRQASKASSLSSTSSNHLGLLGDEEDKEDWTQSVLLAAGAEGNWKL
jgi:hypothetical protein